MFVAIGLDGRQINWMDGWGGCRNNWLATWLPGWIQTAHKLIVKAVWGFGPRALLMF